MKPFQFVYSKLVPSNSAVALVGHNPFTWISDVFPFVVPQGHELRLSSMFVSSKFRTERASYFVISNVMSVSDTGGVAQFNPPIRVPSGVTLTASLINNAREQQWMEGVATGWLVPL